LSFQVILLADECGNGPALARLEWTGGWV